MRIVKVGVLAPTNKGIPLGVQGENRATDVEFDTRPWFREYPHGTVSAVTRRNGDPAPYPLSLDVADGTAVWKVSDTDTAKAGEGAVELTMTSAESRVRSLTFKTLVTASLTDAPVDDDAWYGWLDKAVVKVDETVQTAQRKMAEVDEEWTGLKADVTSKVEKCGKAAEQAAEDAHHAKVDAQATAKALESAEGSVAKAEAAANRAVDAMLDADDSAVEASRSALSAGDSAESARLSADAAANSAGDASTSARNAADAASAASGSASAAEQSATDASNAKAAAQTAKDEAATSARNAATSASNAAASATAAAKSASDAADSVNAINVIAPKTVDVAASSEIDGSFAVGAGSVANKLNEFSIGNDTLTREITHVSTPTAPTSASTKKYTDDNDAKTLSEAKKYTDDNTSNALVGKVSGKLLHVEDAWPSKPLSLTIDGAYKQDGTPSPENPVPIQVIENPVLNATGRNLLDVHAGMPESDCNKNFEKITKRIIKPGTYVEGLTSNNYLFKNVESLQIGDGAVSFKSNTRGYGVGFGVSLIPGVTYTFGANNIVNAEFRFAFYAADGTWLSQVITFTPTVPNDAVYSVLVVTSIDTTLDVAIHNMYAATSQITYAPYVGTSLPITMPAEHPYLAKLPDGTCDTIEIDKDGNVSLVARVSEAVINASKAVDWGKGKAILNFPSDGRHGNGTFNKKAVISQVLKGEDADKIYKGTAIGISVGSPYMQTIRCDTSLYLGDGVDVSSVDGTLFYYPLMTPVTYPLGKLDIPSLPEAISNVWTDAKLTTDMSMTYKRDINIAFDNLAQAVVAAAAGE